MYNRTLDFDHFLKLTAIFDIRLFTLFDHSMILSKLKASLGRGAILIGFWYVFFCTDYPIMDKLLELCPSI